MKKEFWFGIGGAVLTALVIYATPLQYLPLMQPTINDIGAQEFSKMYEENPDKYLFIDVRPDVAYANIHAVDSVNMPLHTLYDERHSFPKSGKTIVLICSGGRASGVGYHYLEHFGFTNIRRIEGGIEAWALAGLPVEGKNISNLLTPSGTQ